MAEAKKLKYVGPIDEVSIPALGVSVKRNHTIDVEDKAVYASLVAQADWEDPTKAKGKNETPPTPPKAEG